MNKDVFSNLTYGLYIISTKYEDHFAGCIVNTVVQATTEEKPKLIVIVNKENDTNITMKKSKKVNLSVLSEEADMLLIGKFGFRSSKDYNKLENTEYKIGNNNIPVITEKAVSYIEASVINEIDLTTHTIFVLEANETEVISNKPVMTYDYYHKVVKGKTPPKASSFAV